MTEDFTQVTLNSYNCIFLRIQSKHTWSYIILLATINNVKTGSNRHRVQAQGSKEMLFFVWLLLLRLCSFVSHCLHKTSCSDHSVYFSYRLILYVISYLDMYSKHTCPIILLIPLKKASDLIFKCVILSSANNDGF